MSEQRCHQNLDVILRMLKLFAAACIISSAFVFCSGLS